MAPVRLIVGLGNPGAEYSQTRHNAGFMVVDALLERQKDLADPRHYADSYIWNLRHAGKTVLVQKPQTYMNRSGLAVAKLCREQKILPEEILVLVDDLDLPLGRVRLRQKGSSGGHNGLKSLIEELGSGSFNRLRIGIANDEIEDETIDFVLSAFAESESERLEKVLKTCADAVFYVIRRDMVSGMNEFNRLSFEETDSDETTE